MTEELFEDGEIETREPQPTYPQIDGHIWTKRKALLIKLYLELFVHVTYRGTYIDAFSGPQYLDEGQDVDEVDNWAAKLLWSSAPGKRRKRIDRFELFEKSQRSLLALRKMIKLSPELERLVRIWPGDSNIELPKMLADHPVKDPAFCLLDQRSTECSWDLVKTVSQHKASGPKIEIFYFLMAQWKERSLENLKNDPIMVKRRWWGREDIEILSQANRQRLSELFTNRFKDELGYEYVNSFPIFDGSGTIKYYMIHASDHAEAPKFMFRAYRKLSSGYDPRVSMTDFGWDDAELVAKDTKLLDIPSLQTEENC